MTNRWAILIILFCARMAMGFQFQAIPALSPVVIETYALDLTALGFLIGLYVWPGIIMAMPGGAIGSYLGDVRTVTLGLFIMTVGGVLIAAVPTWEAQIAGRLLGGTGGILLNVMMTKLVADYFSDKEIATAMGIFVNSWPVGIALALVILPPIALSSGLAAALWATVGVIAAALVLFATLIRPPREGTQSAPPRVPLRGLALTLLVISALIWGLYNAALSMVFGFGPAMLSEAGLSVERAALATSLVLWLVALSIPLGGFLADRTGRRDLVTVLSSLGFALTLVMAAEGLGGIWAFVAMGLLGGLAAGPVMALATLALSPGNRASGMGLFFCLYYIVMALAPILAGAVSDAVGTSRAAFHLGAVFLLMSIAVLAVFRLLLVRFQERSAGPAAPASAPVPPGSS